MSVFKRIPRKSCRKKYNSTNNVTFKFKSLVPNKLLLQLSDKLKYNTYVHTS